MLRALSAASTSLFVLSVAIACSSDDHAGSDGNGSHSGGAGGAGATANGGQAGDSVTPQGGNDVGGSAGSGLGGGGTDGGATPGGTGALAGGEGGAPTGGAGGAEPMASGGYCAGKVAEALPMVVSDKFVPSGYVVVSPDFHRVMEACPSRPASPVGDCFTFEWAPSTTTYDGIAFQYPAGNWNTEPGLCVEDGAKLIRAKVRGAAGGEKVQLMVPGAFSQIVTLTTSWQEVQLSLQGIYYNAVNTHGGVGVGLELFFPDAAPGKQRVYIDDMRWE